MCAGFASALIVAGCAILVNRFEIEAWWYCRQLAQARSRNDAEPWMERLRAEPGREAKLSAAWRRLDQGEQWFDMWMLEISPFFSDGNPEHKRVQQWQFRVMAREIGTRPEVLAPMAHFLLWQGWADPDQELTESTFDLAPCSDDDFPVLAHIYFWIVSLDEERSWISSKSTAELLAFWHVWWVENGPYLRFDSAAARFRLDADAKRAEQPVPREDQCTKSMITPFSNWIGPPPY